MKAKLFLLIPLAASLALGGCTEKVQIQQNQEAITQAKTMREYFTKSGGDYKSLTPAEQADAQKQIKGSPEDVQKMFDWMKTSNKTGPSNGNNMPSHR